MRAPTRIPSVRRGGLVAALLVGAALAPRLAAQVPTGPTVVSGNASVSNGQNSVTVTAGNNSVLKWASFNVGSGSLVQFVQPSSTARVLNWIGGLSPAQINGKVTGNGEVYLVDAAGIYFGKTAVVDFGSFYAVGGALSKDDFLKGFDRFTSLTGAVRNDGTIQGSTIALVGRSVANTGTIVSPGGYVALGAGNEVILGHDGSDITVNAGTATAGPPVAATGIANTGTINAGGGTAVLAAGDIYSVAIAAGGQLRAHNVSIEGNGGEVLVSGTVDASAVAAGSVGGTVAITGGKVGLLTGASVNASGPAGGGTILVGGDLHGANAAVPDATDTTVESGVTLNASATGAGNGGKVVVWSNSDTEYRGAIAATGGPAGGNGGFTEVSGAHLGFFGTVDLTAPLGGKGTLLLDPLDLMINDEASTADANVTGASPFTPTAAGSVLTWTTLLGALSTANVTVTTSGTTGAAAGNITIAESPNAESNSGAYNASFGLTLTAANNVILSPGASVVNAGTGYLTLNAAGSIALGGSIGTGGTLTLNSATGITQSAGTVSGALVLQGAGDAGAAGTPLATGISGLTLGTGAGYSGNAYLSQTGGLALQGTTGGSLTVTATGAVTNPATLSVTGTTTVTATGQPITLGTSTNVLTGAVSLAGSNVAVVDSTALVLGATTATGTLNVTAGGTITQTGAITATGGVTTVGLTAAGDIDLTNTSNNFGSNAPVFGGTLTDIQDVTLVNASATAAEPSFAGLTGLTDVTLDNTAAGLAVPVLSIAGNLAVTAAGPITEAGALAVGGTSSFSAGANAITLTQANALTGPVSLTNSGANAVALTNTLATVLGASSVGSGTLTVDSTSGAISQSGALTQAAGAGTATFDAGAQAITLTQANGFTGPVQLDNSGANAVALTNAGATVLGTSSVGSGTFTVTSATGAISETGDITQAAGAGTASFSAGPHAITLNENNFLNGVVVFSNSGANNVIFANTVPTTLGASSVGSGFFEVNSVGAITQTGAITQAPGAAGADFAASANAITLTQANGFTGPVQLDNSGANAVALTNGGATNLGPSAVGTGTLTVTSTGAITESGAITQAAGAGAASFSAGANQITLTQANSFTGAVSLNNSGANAVALTNGGTTNLGVSSVGTGTLTVTSTAGAITQSGALTQAAGAGLATFNAGANGIALTQANSFTGAVSVSGSNVAVTNSGALTVAAATATGTLQLTAAGNLTQTGAITDTGGATTVGVTVAAATIDLGNPANNFGAAAPTFGGTPADIQSLTIANANAGALLPSFAGLTGLTSVTIDFPAAAIAVPTLTLDGSLSLTAGGPITQTGAITQTSATALTTFNAGAHPITLTAANDISGPVSLNNSGANAVAFDNSVATNLGASSVGTGTLIVTSGGAITESGVVTQAAGAGAATFNAGANMIALTQANGFTGAVSLNNSGTNSVALTNGGATTLGSSTVGSGALTVTSTSGAISESGAVTQSAGAGTATFNAGSNPIALTQTNGFTGSVSLNNSGANAVALTNGGATTLGMSAVGSGALTVTSTSGTISESGAVTQAAGATSASFSAGAFPILLTAGNVFTGPVQLFTTSFATVDDLDGLILGSSNVGGALTVSSGGSISQTGAITATGGTTLTLTAPGSAITLGNAGNNFGTVNPVISAGSLLNVVSLTLANDNPGATVPTLAGLTNLASLTLDFPGTAIALPTLTLTGSLSLTAGGVVTQTGPAAIGGTTSISAGAHPITLTQANDFVGAVSLNNSGANAVALTNTGATVLGTSSVGTGTFTVTSTSGAISETGGVTQAAGAGAATFDAGANAIVLTQGNAFTGAVSLNNSGAGAVALTNGGATDLATSSVGTGTLAVTSGGALTQSGSVTQAAGGGAVTIMGSGGITLTNAGNDFTGTVALGDSGDPVALTNGAPLRLGASQAGTLAIMATGPISQGGALAVSGISSFNAGTANVTLTNPANAFTGAVSATGANVALTNGSALVAGNIAATGTLGLTAAGTISQSVSGVITDTGGATTVDVTAAGSQIQLTNALNQFGSASPVFNGGANIIDLGFANASSNAQLPSLASLTALQGLALDFPNSSIAVPALTLSGNLSVISGGSITQQAGIIVVGGTSTFQGASGVDLPNANQLSGAISLGASGSAGVTFNNTLATNIGTTSLGTGALTVTSGGAITQSAALATDGAASFTAGANPITLTNPNNAMTGSISLNNSGAHNVALTNGGAGTILGPSSVGSGTLTVVTTSGGITETAPIATSGDATFTAASGSIALNQANDLTGTVSLNTSGTGGASLTNTVTTTLAASTVGSGTLAVNSGGAIAQSGALAVAGPSSFSAGGASVELTNPANTFAGPVSLQTTLPGADADLAGAGTVYVGGSAVGGNLSVTGGSAVGLTGAITTGGTQAYNSPVTLTGSTTLTGTTLSLASTLAGNGQNLTLDFSGGETVNGALMTGIGSLTTEGASTLLLGSITTSGGQNYNAPTSLGGNTTLTGTTLNIAGTLNGNGYNLTLDFSSFSALDGSMFSDVANLTTGGGAATLSGDLTTSGSLTFGNAITLVGNTTITTAGSPVTFNSTINGGFDLTILSGGSSPSFRGAVGSSGPLGTLTLTNSSPAGVALSAITASELVVTTAGPVTNAGGLVISGEAKINAGNNPITLGTTTSTSIGSLDLTGSNVTVDQSAGTLHIVDATAGALTLTNTGGGVQLDNAAVGTGVETGSGALAINANGSVVFGAAGSASISALSLDVEAHGTVTELVPIDVTGSSTINANGYDVNLGTSQNTFSTLSVTGADVTINDSNQLEIQKIAASGSLTVDSTGQLTVGRSVNGVANITLISNTGGITFLTPDSTATLLTAAGNLTVESAQGISFGANTGLKANGELSITSGGALTMNAASSLTGGTGLTIKAGGDAILGTFSSTSGPTAVTATGTAEFLDPVTLAGATTVTAGSGGVKFDGTVDGGSAAQLTVTTAGTTTFTAALGATSAPGTIQTTGSGPVLIEGGSAAAATALAFGGPVTLAENTTFTAPAVTFGSTLDSAAGGAVAVTITSATASFDGAVGSAATLASLTVNGGSLVFGASAAATAVANGSRSPDATTAGTVTTSGAQTYGSALSLQEDTTLTSTGAGTITLGGGANGGFALALATAGTAQVNSTLGATTPLGSFAAGATTFNAAGSAAQPTVATTGTQTYSGAVTLQQGTVLTSTGASGGITLDEAVSGPGFALALNAPLATVTAVGNLGSSSGRLASVSTDGGNVVIGADIWAQGNIDLGIGDATSATGNSYIAFNTSQAPGDTRIDSAAGTITLGSGTGGSSAKTAAPLASSIFKSNSGDLYLFGSSVVVEPYERLAVSGGSLVALADGTAAGDGVTLSSTAVADDLVISTANQSGPSIFLRSRPPANVLATNSNTTSPDQGMDLVAGAVLFFNARFGPIPTRTQYAPESSAGSAYFDYAVETGNILSSGGNLVLSILPDSGGTAVNVFVADLLTKNDFRPIVPNLVYLDLSTVPGFAAFQNSFISQPTFGLTTDVPLRDLVSTGAETRNSLEQAFTPDVPLEEEQAPAVEADIAEGVREQLQALGIYARRLFPDELASRARHTGLFVCIPEKERPRLADYQVADARVEDRAVRDVITLAVRIGLLGNGQEKLNAVAKSLTASFNAFSAENPQGDAAQYRRWLAARTDPDSQRVTVFMGGLREVMRRVSLLGLTGKELEGSKAQIYGSILSQRLYVDAEFLRTLVEGLQTPAPVALSAPVRNPSSVQASNP